jgi:hypothetical protein
MLAPAVADQSVKGVTERVICTQVEHTGTASWQQHGQSS